MGSEKGKVDRSTGAPEHASKSAHDAAVKRIKALEDEVAQLKADLASAIGVRL